MVGTSTRPELLKGKIIMTDYIKVEESYVAALIENAAWGKARIDVLTEGDKKGDKSKDKPGDKPDFTTGARKGDKGKKKGDKPDFTTGARKGDEDEKGTGTDFEREDEVNTKGPDTDPNDKSDAVKKLAQQGQADAEAGNDTDEMKEKKSKKSRKESTQEHTCPLCESTLEEELSDAQIYEHIAQIQAALSTIEEGGDDDDDVEPTDADLDKIENENKKSKVMNKVKELKKAARGK
tara:strand:- start:378 stop:1085 length:708 start_codon:yes stop_codon:yes gene_type:complete